MQVKFVESIIICGKSQSQSQMGNQTLEELSTVRTSSVGPGVVWEPLKNLDKNFLSGSR